MIDKLEVKATRCPVIGSAEEPFPYMERDVHD